jgi:hypothetical protein
VRRQFAGVEVARQHAQRAPHLLLAEPLGDAAAVALEARGFEAFVALQPVAGFGGDVADLRAEDDGDDAGLLQRLAIGRYGVVRDVGGAGDLVTRPLAVAAGADRLPDQLAGGPLPPAYSVTGLRGIVASVVVFQADDEG